MFRQSFLITLLGLSWIVIAPLTASAMSIEPVVLDVMSFGGNSQQSFRVMNDGNSSLPVEIVVSRMELDADGQPQYEPAEDDFLIYPPQAIIASGGAQNFRVQWIGDPNITVSRNYRISVSQLPVSLPSESAGIQILMSFGIAVGVSPPESKASMSIKSAVPTKNKDGASFVALDVRNDGNRHAYFGHSLVSLSGSGWSANLNSSEILQKLGLGIVQPGKERRFLIPMDVPPGVSDITASIDYKPEN